jgi:NRAMP (natural resistance-associated macrophage protein)-like metal ion transporter
MSIAFIDPGNLESDLQAGVIGGYSLLWVLLWSTVFGLFLQVLSSRLAVVTGLDLATHCRLQFPRGPRYFLWVMTELAIIGSDVQEVVGSAIAMKILFKTPMWLGVVITAADTFTFLILHYFGVRKLEALFAGLIAMMIGCFTSELVIAKPDFAEIGRGVVVPYVPRNATLQAVGMLGAVIMPHNLFLNSSLVLSREVDRENEEDVAEANKYFGIESSIALSFSFVINAIIVAVFAVGFHAKSAYDGTQIGLREAGTVLEKTFGRPALYIWAVGLLAAGQSSTMCGTLAGQCVMSGFLQLNVPSWIRVGITRSLAIIPALVVAILFIDDMDNLDEWLNVLQSLQLPFALLPLLKFTSSEGVMGSSFVNNRVVKIAAWTIAAIILATNVYLVQSFARFNIPHTPLIITGLVLMGIGYVAMVGYISVNKPKHVKDRFDDEDAEVYEQLTEI